MRNQRERVTALRAGMKTNCALVALVALLAACSDDTSKRVAGSAAQGRRPRYSRRPRRDRGWRRRWRSGGNTGTQESRRRQLARAAPMTRSWR